MNACSPSNCFIDVLCFRRPLDVVKVRNMCLYLTWCMLLGYSSDTESVNRTLTRGKRTYAHIHAQAHVTRIHTQKYAHERCQTKTTVYSDSTYPKPNSSHSLVPPGIFCPIDRVEPFSGQNSSPGRGQNTVRFGKMTRNYQWVPKMC